MKLGKGYLERYRAELEERGKGIRKGIRQEIAASSLYEGEDSRFYTRISINGDEIEGLLDSGATVTCLDKECE